MSSVLSKSVAVFCSSTATFTSPPRGENFAAFERRFVTTWINLPALIIMLILTAMLSWGVRESARLNNVMVAIKVGVVLLFIVVGAKHVQPANWQPGL